MRRRHKFQFRRIDRSNEFRRQALPVDCTKYNRRYQKESPNLRNPHIPRTVGPVNGWKGRRNLTLSRLQPLIKRGCPARATAPCWNEPCPAGTSVPTSSLPIEARQGRTPARHLTEQVIPAHSSTRAFSAAAAGRPQQVRLPPVRIPQLNSLLWFHLPAALTERNLSAGGVS